MQVKTQKIAKEGKSGARFKNFILFFLTKQIKKAIIE
jgi:hypothetical protein